MTSAKRRRRRAGRGVDFAVSLLLAVLLWLYVGGERIEERTYFVHVRVGLPSEDLAYTVEPPRVAVTLRGAARLLDAIAPERDLLCRLSIASADPGAYSRPVDAQAIEGEPKGIEVLRIEPSEVKVVVRETVRAMRPVRLSVEDETPPGAVSNAYRVEPAEVEVRAPRRVLEEIPFVPTEPFPAAEAAPNRSVPLLLPPGARATPETVVLRPVETGSTGTGSTGTD